MPLMIKFTLKHVKLQLLTEIKKEGIIQSTSTSSQFFRNQYVFMEKNERGMKKVEKPFFYSSPHKKKNLHSQGRLTGKIFK